MNEAGSAETLGAAAQDAGIARHQAQRARIRRHIGAALINYANHPQRRGNALNIQPIRPDKMRQNAAHRVRQGRHIFHTARHGLNAGSVQRQAVNEGAGGAAGNRLGHIQRIGSQNIGGAAAHIRRSGHKGGALGLCGGQRQCAGGFAGKLAQSDHVRHASYPARTISSRWIISARPGAPSSASISPDLRPTSTCACGES